MDGFIRIGTKVDDKGIDDGIKDIERKIDVAEKQKIIIETDISDKQQKLSQTSDQLDKLKAKAEDLKKTFSGIENGGTMSPTQFKNMQTYNALIPDIQKAQKEHDKISSSLDKQKLKLQKINNLLSNYRDKVDKINLKKQEEQMKNLNKNSQKQNKVLGTIISSAKKWTLAVIGLRAAYAGVRRMISLVSQYNQQITTNMQYVGFAIAKVFEPIIVFILNGLAKILSLINQVIFLLTGKNLFKNSGISQFAKAMGSASDSSKEIKNNLANFDDLEVLKEDDSDTAGAGTMLPSFDISGTTSEFDGILASLFDPFIKAWQEKGITVIESIKKSFNSIKELGKTVFSSFEKIWTNGTVQKGAEIFLEIISKIFDIIGHIAEAWKKAWERNDMGDKIIQNFADAINNILTIVRDLLDLFDKFTQTAFFQFLTDLGLAAIADLSSLIEWLTEKIKNFFDFLDGNMSLEELDTWDIIIGSIATSILAVWTAVTLVNVVTSIFNGIATVTELILSALNLKFLIIVAVIASVIAIGILLCKNWDKIKEKAIELRDKVVETFSNFKDKVSEIWDGIWEKIKSVINSILAGVESMSNGVVNGINTIINALNRLSFTIPDWVPEFGGKSFGFNIAPLANVSLPRLAKGTILSKPTPVIAGEAGKEAIIPLENNTEGLEMIADMISQRLGNMTIQASGNGKWNQFIKFLNLEIKQVQKNKGTNLIGGIL